MNVLVTPISKDGLKLYAVSFHFPSFSVQESFVIWYFHFNVLFAEGIKTIPVQSLDPNIQVLVISSSKSPLTISPIFIPFTKLEVLQINEASIQSIGVHSFWGVQSLRMLGMYIVNNW